VLVVVGDGGVVVANDAGYAPLADQGDHLVGPGGVAYEVAKVVHGADFVTFDYVREHRFKAGQVRAYVGYHSAFHGSLQHGRRLSIKNSLCVSGGP
jgi:hypothetical protein